MNEVLDLASIESGKLELEFEDVEVGPLLAETMALVGPLARARGVRMNVAPTAAMDGVFVRVEGRRLKQVLLNLLDNAVKYNRPVGGEVFVDARVERSAADPATATGLLRMSVRDTGAGIDDAGLERLFTPFERLGAAHGPIKGTGLGLAVSKQLVERMGGQMRVTSEVGRRQHVLAGAAAGLATGCAAQRSGCLPDAAGGSRIPACRPGPRSCTSRIIRPTSRW